MDHVHLLEVPDRPRDGGRAHLERLPELSRRHAPVVVGQQAGEHPGRQPRHTRCGEGGAEALDEARGVRRGGVHGVTLLHSEFSEHCVPWRS